MLTDVDELAQVTLTRGFGGSSEWSRRFSEPNITQSWPSAWCECSPWWTAGLSVLGQSSRVRRSAGRSWAGCCCCRETAWWRRCDRSCSESLSGWVRTAEEGICFLQGMDASHAHVKIMWEITHKQKSRSRCSLNNEIVNFWHLSVF